MPYHSVVNLTDTVLSLAGVVQLQPKRATLINVDGFHVGIRSYVESSLNSSIRGNLVQELATGTREACESAVVEYSKSAAEASSVAVATSDAAAASAAKVETAVLPGVFADGKAAVETAVASPTLDNTKPQTPAPQAPISKPAPVVNKGAATLAQQADLLAAVTQK